MLKSVVLISRKPGLSRAQFVQHYETSHVPLVKEVFAGLITDYRRNFVQLEGAILGDAAAATDFDSVTEISYKDRASYDRMLDLHFNTDVGTRIAADEAKFLDSTKTRFFLVEEHGGKVDAAPAGATLKVVALLVRKPGLSRADFLNYYETRHVPLIQRSFTGHLVEYRRNFIEPDGAILGDAAGAADFDVVTEIWFKDRASYDAMLAMHAKTDVGKRIAEDEANFLDSSKTRFYVVEETGGPLAG